MLSEAKGRIRRALARRAADAALTASFVLPLHSPQGVVRSMAPPSAPYDPSSSMLLIDKTVKRRRKATASGLDNSRVVSRGSKTFKEFVEEAYLIERGQPHFSSRQDLEKHHGGIPSGYYANNAGSTESPKWRLKPKSGGVEERKARAERIATLSSAEEQKAAANKAKKLKKAGLDAHHITPLHYSANLRSSMSDAEWEQRKERDAKEGIYHGHHPKNIMGTVTDKTPESRSRTGIRHRAGGAHELEGKTKDIAHVGHKGLLSAAHRRQLKQQKSEGK